MRVTRLEADNFLSYDSLDLDLTGIDQAGIVGANGAGKSSLLDLFTWTLFGVGRGSADDLLREGTDLMRGAVEFELGERRFRVERERSKRTARGESTLTLLIDDERHTGHTLMETQAAINRHLGLDLAALLAGPIMVQSEDGEPHDLMHLKQAARMDLLIDLFGLNVYERYLERAKEAHGRAQLELAGIEARLTEYDALIADELEARRERQAQEAVVAALSAEVERMTEEVATLREEAATLLERAKRQEALDAELAQAQRDLDGQTQRLATLQAETEKRHARLREKPVLPPTHDPRAIERRLAEILPLVEQLDGMRERHGVLQTQWKMSAANAKTLETVPCQNADGPHAEMIAATCIDCRFLVDAKAGRDRLPDIKQDGIALKAEIDRLEAQRHYADTLAREYREAVEQRAAHQADFGQRTAAEEFLAVVGEQMLDAERAIESLSQAISRGNAERLRIAQDVRRRDEVAGRLRALSEQLVDARNEQAAAERRLMAATTRVERIADAKERRRSVGQERDRVHNRVEALRLLTQAFGRDGIPKLILENGLPLIEERANEILDRMPGGWAVSIVTQRELKSGGTREALEVVITAAGVERPYRMLSGGERFRVDFALRMALATVLARRSGTQVETLWLDEGWGSQDREGREALLEAIASVTDEFRLMLIVSHVPEVTDAMPQRIEVTKENGVSRVEVAA